MLKVIQINAHARLSTGNIAAAITEKLDNDSKQFYAIEQREEKSAKRFYSKFERTFDIAMTRLTGMDSVWSWGNTNKIIKELKRENPDIIHLHNLHGFYLNYKKLFRYIKKNNKKVVWTLHDCWALTGHCPHFDYIGCNKWKTECKNCPQYKQSYLKSYLFDRSKHNHKTKKKSFLGVENLVVVTPSEWLASLAKESFLGTYPVKVVNNGVNTENFSICENETFKDIIPADKKVVIAVTSSWGKLKGYDDVIEISRRLPEDYVVVMVGVTAVQKKSLEGERIIAITRTHNQRELAELYSSAKVFVNATYEETYPMVNIESLCCGCPIVTYKTGGSVETINESTGIIVEKGNVDAMIEAVIEVSNRDYDRETMSSEAKKRYSKENMVEGYIKLYETL